jgi:hypothetical protein
MTLQFLSRERLRSHREYVDTYLESAIRRDVIRPGGSDVVEIVAYLERCFELGITYGITVAAGYSKARWLWYLRRVPDWIFDDPSNFVSGSTYNRSVAEILTVLGGATDTPNHSGSEYPIDEQVVDDVLRLVATVRYLGNVNWLIRTAGRGVRLVFEGDGELPVARPTELENTAFQLYWGRRFSNGDRFMARAGVPLFDEARDPSHPLSLITFSRHPPVDTSVDLDSAEGVQRLLIPRTYNHQYVQLNRVADLAGALNAAGASWPSPEFGTIALSLSLATEIVSRNDVPWVTTLQVGFFSVDLDFLLEIFDRWWRQSASALDHLLPRVLLPDSPEALAVALQSLEAGISPIRRGPLLRVDGNFAIFDFDNATTALEMTLDFPAIHGRTANARSWHFENVVQREIDRSRGAPPESLRALRGRTLRKGVKSITDVDAVATKIDELLIVSAKSIVFSRALDRGDHNVFEMR